MSRTRRTTVPPPHCWSFHRRPLLAIFPPSIPRRYLHPTEPTVNCTSSPASTPSRTAEKACWISPLNHSSIWLVRDPASSRPPSNPHSLSPSLWCHYRWRSLPDFHSLFYSMSAHREEELPHDHESTWS